MVNISIGSAAIVVVLGMGVVFLGLILLMFVVQIMSRCFIAKEKKNKASALPQAGETVLLPEKKELKLYDTDPRDAAMIMAIVADELKTPLNRLRFISIRRVDE